MQRSSQKSYPNGISRSRFNKYGHLTWKESRPENTELRQRNEAARAEAQRLRYINQ
jgi:hypothetical protein